MLVKDKKYFEGFRWFALFTLLCTMAMWIVLWASSATPASISGANSSAMASAIDDKFNLTQKFDSAITTQNIIVERGTEKARYIGEQEQMKITFSPKGTLDTDVEWSSRNENVATVDQNGLVTLVGKGNATIYAQLKSNEKLYNYAGVFCWGENPHNVENPHVRLKDNVKSVKVGSSTTIILNDNKTHSVAASYRTSDESVAIVDAGMLHARKAGEVTITATYSDGFECSCDVTVVDNPEYVCPTQIILQDKHIEQGGSFDVYDFVKGVLPNNDFQKCIVTITQSKSIAGLSNTTLNVWGYGEFTLTFTSCFNENVKASITLYSNIKMPEDFRVSIPSVASPNNTYYLKAAHYPYPCTDEVKWELVSGKHATLDEDGVFKARFFGTYVIRCTSTIDPNLSVEKTIEVKLFDDIGGFVRKLMGHMGLSGVLGFGLFFTCLFLCKNKWKCAVYPFAISFVHGGLSEAIQYFTPGRFCSFADVLVDFMGGCVGIVLGMILAGLILLIWKLANKQSFDRAIYAIKSLRFGNCFKKMPRFDAEYVREEVDTQPRAEEPQAIAVA